MQRGIKQVDVIIGGPPCQAYSLVGRAQSKHMETPMSADPRNDLYKLYARFLRNISQRCSFLRMLWESSRQTVVQLG